MANVPETLHYSFICAAAAKHLLAIILHLIDGSARFCTFGTHATAETCKFVHLHGLCTEVADDDAASEVDGGASFAHMAQERHQRHDHPLACTETAQKLRRSC